MEDKFVVRNASFEGILPNYNRPQIWLGSLEAKKEVTSFDRLQLLKNARWAVNNYGLAARIVRGVTRYALANGLVPQSQSQSTEFCRLAEEYFKTKYIGTPFAFDKAGQVDFLTAQIMLCESMITDGDVFVQLVRSGKDSPMIRIIGGEYVGDAKKAKTKTYDGVGLNSDGRPIFFRVLEAPYGYSNVFYDVPADDIIHVKRIHRLGYVRGISWFGSSVARIQDIREALDNELLSAKLNSKIALVVESNEIGRSGLGVSVSQASQGEKKYNMDELVPGAGTVTLRPGEKLVSHNFVRPQTNLTTFIDYLTREIAYTIGVSPEVIWSMMSGLTGPATRFSLQDADVFFGGIRKIIENNFCVRFWRYAIWHGIKSGDLPRVEDWYKVKFTPPHKISIDFGRDSRVMIDLVKSGLMSKSYYFTSLGQNYEDEVDDMLRDELYIRKRIEELKKSTGVDLSPKET